MEQLLVNHALSRLYLPRSLLLVPARSFVDTHSSNEYLPYSELWLHFVIGAADLLELSRLTRYFFIIRLGTDL